MPDKIPLEKIKQNITELLPTLVKIRHTIHQNPELAFEEKNTQKIIEKYLVKNNYKLFDKFIETDVVCEINNNKPITIVLRADMDALPIIEENKDISYCSKNNGVAHSCGHDGHTTIMLGVATILQQYADLLPINVRLVFQPAEEMARGGEIIVKKGVLKDVNFAYALHCWPKLTAGHISCCPNTIFAAGSFFTIKINGVGCHGATPKLGNSPFPAMAKVIKKINKLHTKYQKTNGSVISICTVNGGNAASVIPNTITLSGTIRHLDKNDENTIKEDFNKILSKIEQKFDIKTQIEFSLSILPTVNDPQAYQHIKKTAIKYLGEKYYEDMLPAKTMEDFAYFLDKVPGALFMLGVGEDKPSLHNPSFNFNDDALNNGILLFCLLALTFSTND